MRLILSKIYSFFQQKKYKKMTAGREKFWSWKKQFEILKKNKIQNVNLR